MIVEPSLARSPAAGSCEITSSRGTSSDTRATNAISNPRLCATSAASLASRPTRFGTSTFLPANVKYAPTAISSRTKATSAHTHQLVWRSSSTTGSITTGRVGTVRAFSSAAMNASALW